MGDRTKLAKIKSLPRRLLALYGDVGFLGISRRVWQKGAEYCGRSVRGVEPSLEYFAPSESLLRHQRNRSLSFENPPLISVLLPVYNTPKKYLTEVLDSVLAQSYPFWELCVADDCSTDPTVRRVLEKYSSEDDRIRLQFRRENGHIAACSNSALELVTGEYFALLDHDDVLSPEALFQVACAILQEPDADVFYSDENKITPEGRYFESTAKGGWSPTFFSAFMYIGHLTTYRTSLVRSVGGFRAGTEGSQDYDLALRVSEVSDRFVHIPHVLYHWRAHRESVAGNIDAKPYAFIAARKSLKVALARREVTHARLSETSLKGVSSYSPRESIRFASDVVRISRSGSRQLVSCGSGPRHRGTDIAQHFLVHPSCHWRQTMEKLLEQGSSPYILFHHEVFKALDPNWHRPLVSTLAFPEVGVVGGGVVDRAGRLVVGPQAISSSSGKGGYFQSLYGFSRRAGCQFLPRTNVSHEVPLVLHTLGGCRREVLEEVLQSAFELRTPLEFSLALCGVAWKGLNLRVLWDPQSRFLTTPHKNMFAVSERDEGRIQELLEYFKLGDVSERLFPRTLLQALGHEDEFLIEEKVSPMEITEVIPPAVNSVSMGGGEARFGKWL